MLWIGLLITIAGCSEKTEDIEPGDETSMAAALPPPTPTPSANWDEVEGSTYFYIAEVSEEDRQKGRAAGEVLAFQYQGLNDKTEHVLASLASDGSVVTRSFCKDPCKIIRREDGTRLGYSPGSIIGSAFQDAIAGRMVPATPPKKPRLVMAELSENAWTKLGSGCACQFSATSSSRPMFLAGGDDNLIVRPYGREAICRLKDSRMQEMFDGAADLQCGGARISVRKVGEAQSGEDGYSSQGKMTVSDNSEERSWSGSWSCGC